MVFDDVLAVALTPWGLLFLGLVIGSFLNVVIHRLPIMLEREWKTQAQDLLADPRPANELDTALEIEPASIAASGDALVEDGTGEPTTLEVAPEPIAERYNLIVPRSRCPKCNAEITALQNIPVICFTSRVIVRPVFTRAHFSKAV